MPFDNPNNWEPPEQRPQQQLNFWDDVAKPVLVIITMLLGLALMSRDRDAKGELFFTGLALVIPTGAWMVITAWKGGRRWLRGE